MGSIGDSYDNALAESINAAYKTELNRARKPQRTVEEVELATLEWVHRFNTAALHENLGHRTPTKAENDYNAGHTRAAALTTIQEPNRGRIMLSDAGVNTTDAIRPSDGWRPAIELRNRRRSMTVGLGFLFDTLARSVTCECPVGRSEVWCYSPCWSLSLNRSKPSMTCSSRGR